LRVCNFDISGGNPLGEEAALHAATASGAFKGAGFEGNGIVAAPKHALDTQFGPPHSGIIYTPPSYSDHVAMSLLFCDSATLICDGIDLDDKDARTKKAQPHKSQTSISSFFGKKDSSGSKSSSSKKESATKKAKVGDASGLAMSNFFRSSSKDAPTSNTATKRKFKDPKFYSSKKRKRPELKQSQKRDGILQHFAKR